MQYKCTPELASVGKRSLKNEKTGRFLLKRGCAVTYAGMINTFIMKKAVIPSVLVAFIMALALFSGCASSNNNSSRDFNALGAIKVTPESYERIDNATFAVHTDQLVARRNVSGDNVQLFWGLITIADY